MFEDIRDVTCLDADRNVREHPHEDLRALDRFNLPLDDLLCRGELLGRESFAVLLYSDAPVAKRKRSALDGASSRNWYNTLVSSEVFDAFWCQLRPKPSKHWLRGR